MAEKTKKIEYTNKRGQVVRVLQHTLSKQTTIYEAHEGSADTARYIPGSKLVNIRRQKKISKQD